MYITRYMVYIALPEGSFYYIINPLEKSCTIKPAFGYNRLYICRQMLPHIFKISFYTYVLMWIFTVEENDGQLVRGEW